MAVWYAILLDGGFVVKRLQRELGQFPSADDVVELTNRIRAQDVLRGCNLLRIYFYYAPPATRTVTNPLDGHQLDLGATRIFKQNQKLLDELALRPDFALRLGETLDRGWRLGWGALKNLKRRSQAGSVSLSPNDLVPNVVQKGVDMRVGLDIARVALQRTARIIVAVVGDSDFVPAFKFARREGLRVYLEPLNSPNIRQELKVHTDLVLSTSWP